MSKQERHAEAHRLANAYEEAGRPIMAGLLRVEAFNILERPDDWRPVHKPSIGPYTEDCPLVCMNCDESYVSGEECKGREGE